MFLFENNGLLKYFKQKSKDKKNNQKDDKDLLQYSKKQTNILSRINSNLNKISEYSKIKGRVPNSQKTKKESSLNKLKDKNKNEKINNEKEETNTLLKKILDVIQGKENKKDTKQKSSFSFFGLFRKFKIFSKLFSPVIFLLKKFKKIGGIFARVFLGIITTLMRTPVGLVVTAIATLATVLYSYKDKIKKIISEIWDSVTKTISNVTSNIEKTLSGAWNGIVNSFNDFKNTIDEVVKYLKNLIGNAIKKAKNVATTVYDGAKNVATTVYNSAKNVTTTAIKKTGKFIDDINPFSSKKPKQKINPPKNDNPNIKIQGVIIPKDNNTTAENNQTNPTNTNTYWFKKPTKKIKKQEIKKINQKEIHKKANTKKTEIKKEKVVNKDNIIKKIEKQKELLNQANSKNKQKKKEKNPNAKIETLLEIQNVYLAEITDNTSKDPIRVQKTNQNNNSTPTPIVVETKKNVGGSSW